MDFSTWRPHGLIFEWGMESLYSGAQVTIDANGNLIDPKEHLTVKLFEFLFHRHIFTGDFMCFSQLPDTIGNKACDLVIQYLTKEGAWQVACFAKAKRLRNQSANLVGALEAQALGYCKNFLNANPDIERTYACTMVGASIRCWRYHNGDEALTGFWGGQEHSEFAYYLDIGLDNNKQQIMSAFSHMKSVSGSNLAEGMSHCDIGRKHSSY